MSQFNTIDGDGDAPRLRIALVLLRDFTLSPFAGFIDVLRLSSDEGDRSRQAACRWTVMTGDGRAVRASCGTAITPDCAVGDRGGDLAGFDYVVVFGGLLHGGPPADPRVDAYLVRAADRGLPLVGLCTAVFTLMRLGLMAGRRCCVSWYHYRELLDAFPDVTPVADRLFVVDGPRITCAGGVGAVDLAAWLVDRHVGSAAAAKALHILIADQARPGDAPQPHVAPGAAVRDPRLRRAIRWMEENIADPPRIDALADRLGLSRRQLERIFLDETGQSPSAYCRQLRLTQGRWLLSETNRSVTDIALACGFADASHFARATRSAFGVTPEALRAIARQGQGLADEPAPDPSRPQAPPVPIGAR